MVKEEVRIYFFTLLVCCSLYSFQDALSILRINLKSKKRSLKRHARYTSLLQILLLLFLLLLFQTRFYILKCTYEDNINKVKQMEKKTKKIIKYEITSYNYYLIKKNTNKQQQQQQHQAKLRLEPQNQKIYTYINEEKRRRRRTRS